MKSTIHKQIVIEKLLKIKDGIECDRFTMENIDRFVNQLNTSLKNAEVDTLRANSLQDEIMELIHDARYAMQNADGMTDSDIQGAAMALAMKYTN